MNRFRFAAVLLAGLTALPLTAQTIEPGDDYWVTPPGGGTQYSFPDGDVESLCGKEPASDWDHKVVLAGIAATDSDYDTVIRRLDKVTFTDAGEGATRIMAVRLSLKGASEKTPCGSLNWTVRLVKPQAITLMKLVRTSTSPVGGYFSADIAVNVEFSATSSGTYIGSLFYNLILPDPVDGTPWSFSRTRAFRAGMSTTDNCLDVLRAKLAITTDPRHRYFISDMIAKGECKRG